ncbi:MAG: alpha/beta hydrolase family protein [Limisphaerales bacterium]
MRIRVGGRVIRQWRIVLARALVVALISGGGCARFGAERLAQAPNTYPAILSPPPRLVVDFGTVSLTNLPTRWAYVLWFPRRWLAGALRRLPEVLKVAPGELDPIRAVAGAPVRALFVAGGQDHIAPPADVERFRMASAPSSRLWIVPEAGHEALPHFLPELVGPVLEWLTESANPVVADHE